MGIIMGYSAFLGYSGIAGIAGIADILARIPPDGSGDYSFSPPEGGFLLTNAWQVAQGAVWSEGAVPVGVSLDPATGEFTVTAVARWLPIIERIYHNHDRAPSVPIVIYIKVQVNYNDGNGFVDTPFERSSLIGAATQRDEPAILGLDTSFLIDVATAGTKFRLLFKADEGGATPDEVELAQLKVTTHVVSKIPT